MAASTVEPDSDILSDRHSLLMEQPKYSNGEEHVIDIASRGGVASSSSSSSSSPSSSSSSSSHTNLLPNSNAMEHNDEPSSTEHAPTLQSMSSSSASNSRVNGPFSRRSDGYGRHHQSPFNSGLWILIELVVTMSQIIASVIVLSLSKNENPQAPLFEWVIGYAAGCVATLPLLYWRYLHRNGQGSDQESMHAHQASLENNSSSVAAYTAISVPRTFEEGDPQHSGVASWDLQRTGPITPRSRLHALVDHLKMALDCFFAVWFVVGNVWIFGGHSSSSEAPNLYRLCIAFLTFSCIGYAMPFILCATICCCLPCIISILGFREDLGQTRGATPESVNALPIHKFMSNKNGNREGENFEGIGEGGILAAGTDKERVISAEDAVCCICLAKYIDDDELRELPCIHFFHMECVDKWLKINASCPLCKSELGENEAGPASSTNS